MTANSLQKQIGNAGDSALDPHMDRGAPVAPGQGLLKGGSEAKERRLVARAADELHAQRQARFAPAERQ